MSVQEGLVQAVSPACRPGATVVRACTNRAASVGLRHLITPCKLDGGEAAVTEGHRMAQCRSVRAPAMKLRHAHQSAWLKNQTPACRTRHQREVPLECSMMAARWCLQAYQRQGGGDEASGFPDEDRLHWMYRRGTDLLRTRREADRSGQLTLEERELAVSASWGQGEAVCTLGYIASNCGGHTAGHSAHRGRTVL